MMTHSGQSHPPKPVVLVIDDSPDVHRLLKARLRNEELVLEPAGSGAEGLRLARESPPAIILLDLDMPDPDGFEVLRTLKDDARTQDTPVIVVSALAGSHDKVTAFDLGAVDYITKPFDLTELRVRVRTALRMHRLLHLLAERAQVDGLTGLWNRAYFDRRWSEECAAVVRHGRPVSLAMIDADHFKSINDTFGHPAGDTVLQGLARVLLNECRHSDVACRYGGEEFAVIMPETTPEDGRIVCERIRESVGSIVWPRHPDRRVSVSIGLAGAHGGAGIGPEILLEAADRGLYQAKQTGRNRTVTAPLGRPALAKAG